MHTPERVIRSQPTGLSPLDGHTFEDIAASPYPATVLDEVTHLHCWFYPGETCSRDQGYRHKVHRINGVYCFMINDREDQGKFGNHDGGMVHGHARQPAAEGAVRRTRARSWWCSTTGRRWPASRSTPPSGQPVPNNNPNQYHATIRWARQPPVDPDLEPRGTCSTGRSRTRRRSSSTTARATTCRSRPTSGSSTRARTRTTTGTTTRTPASTGNEQSFYDLVPVITGPQGDYHARGATPGRRTARRCRAAGKHGDLNTPGTLLYEAWARAAGRARRAAARARHRLLRHHDLRDRVARGGRSSTTRTPTATARGCIPTPRGTASTPGRCGCRTTCAAPGCTRRRRTG